MKKTCIEDRIRIERFTDDFIPEGVLKAPDEILDVIAFFQTEKTSEVQYVYKVPFPSTKDHEFAECYDVEFPFQYISKGDYIISLSGVYSCVVTEKGLQHLKELPAPFDYSMDINTIFSIKCPDPQLI